MAAQNSLVADIVLARRSPSSFDCCNIPALDAWLQERSYRPYPAKNVTEDGRLRRGASLIVLYHSGSVVVQGGDVPLALRLLNSLEVR